MNGRVWLPSWPCPELFGGNTALAYDIEPLSNSSILPISLDIMANSNGNGNAFFSLGRYLAASDHIFGPGNIIDSIPIRLLGAPDGLTIPGDYQLSDIPGSSPRYFEITKLDTVKKIVSGIFAFTLYARTGISDLDSIVVTDGRFDFRIGKFSTCSN
jgi:hypothetical protein